MFLSISDIIKFIIVIICILLPYMFAMDGGETPRHRRQMTPRTRTSRTRTPRTRTPRYRDGESLTNPNQGDERLTIPNRDEGSSVNLDEVVQNFQSSEFFTSGESSANPNEGVLGEIIFSSEVSTVKKSCLDWILDEMFTVDNHQSNLSRILEISNLDENVWDTMNIWPRGYTLALLDINREEYLQPDTFCLKFKRIEEHLIPNLTPMDFMACPIWILLSGYYSRRTHSNFIHSKRLINNRLIDVLSGCALRYAVYITRERIVDVMGSYTQFYESPEDFCHNYLGLSPGTKVDFKNCSPE